MHQHHHPHHDKRKETQQVTLIGAAVNTVLSILQIAGGLLTQSQALIADGIHTLSDLISDFIVLFTAQHAHKEADDQHPYGHGRFETIATVTLALLLTLVATGIAIQAVQRLLSDNPLPVPGVLALVIALIAIVSKEGLYHLTLRVARAINSKMLEANAWHHRSDALSSIIVLIGVGGALLGLTWLDAVAAIMVSLMIMRMAVNMLRESVDELVDAGLNPKQVETMRQSLQSLEGVEDVHMLRTRRMSGSILVDAHVQVPSQISVSEGHYIAESAMQHLRQYDPDIADITIHIDPENDEIKYATPPPRSEILALLQDLPEAQPIWSDVQRIDLHYLAGQIEIEIHLQQQPAADSLIAFQQASLQLPYLKKISYLQQLHQYGASIHNSAP